MSWEDLDLFIAFGDGEPIAFYASLENVRQRVDAGQKISRVTGTERMTPMRICIEMQERSEPTPKRSKP